MYPRASEISKNDKVTHPVYGGGTVTEIYADGFLEIQFKAGTKKFSIAFVWEKLVVTKRSTKKIRTRNPKFMSLESGSKAGE